MSSSTAERQVSDEIEWWKERMRRAEKDELAFVCWGIATGLMIARDIYRSKPWPRQ